MGGLVLAMIAGALVPAAVVSALAAREPLPRDCRSGQATQTTVEGALLYSGGQDLWYSEGYPGKPRKLFDLAPPRARPVAGASPSAAAASPSPSPRASSSPLPRPPRIVAADISVDRKLVALMVLDGPSREGSISLQLISPLDPPGTAPQVPWAASPDRSSNRLPSVRILDNGKVLLTAPVTASWLPAPSPAPAPTPTPSPSPSRSPNPAPSRSPTAAALPAATPSPTATPSPAPGVAVVVVAPGPSPSIVAQGPEPYFLAHGHSAWPDTRGYRVPAPLPRVLDRVDGPNGRVAGRQEREVGTPLATHHLNVIAVGRSGQSHVQPFCSAEPGVVPTGFSPDEAQVVLSNGQDSLLLDLSGTHAATRLLKGRLLAWR